MHNIDQLKAMSEDAVKALAEQLGISRIKKMSPQDLIYSIIDKEAEQESGNEPVRAPRLKRPRKGASAPKTEERIVVTAAPVENPEPETKPASSESAPETPKKGKRGRKKKEVSAPAPAPAEEVAAPQPNIEAPAAKAETEAAEPAAPGRKKRGRRKLNADNAPAVEASPVAPAEETKPAETVASEEEASQATDHRGERHEKKHHPQQQPKPQAPQFEGVVKASGVLEIMPDGYGFLRSSDYNYLNSRRVTPFSERFVPRARVRNTSR